MVKTASAALVIVPCLLAANAMATTLTPGASPVPVTQLPDGTFLGTPLASNLSDVDLLGTIHQLSQAVYRDPSGTLTFTYQFLSPGAVPTISILEISGYTGTTIDAFYETDGSTRVPGMLSAEGDLANVTTDRGGSGGGALYVLKTDATRYDLNATAGIVYEPDQTGPVVMDPFFTGVSGVIAPAGAPVPEPAALGAMGTLLGFTLFWRKHRRT